MADDPRASGREPPSAPVSGWGLLMVYAGAQVGAMVLVALATAPHQPSVAAARSLLAVRLTYLLSPAVLLAAGLLGVRLGRLSAPATPLARWPGAAAMLAGVGAGLLLRLAGDLIAVGEQAFTGPIAGNNPLALYPHAFPTVTARVLLVVSVGIVAPAGEELFFRGLLFGWLRHRLGRWPAVVLAGALFGLAHVDPASAGALLQTLPLALPMACIGAGLCLLYERYRTLWVSTAAHAAVNLTAMALVLGA